MFQVRTDLALETKEKFEEDNVELKGVRIHEEERGENIKITEVIIETENGAKSMGKPQRQETEACLDRLADRRRNPARYPRSEGRK